MMGTLLGSDTIQILEWSGRLLWGRIADFIPGGFSYIYNFYIEEVGLILRGSDYVI